MECQKWWNENCLYLAPEARKEFKKAYLRASDHLDFLNERKVILKGSKADKHRLSEINELIRKNWDDISKAGISIVEGVELPTLGENEIKEIASKEQG